MNPYFPLSDPRSVIWSIQAMLQFLSRFDDSVLRVNPDGYYGDNTRHSVSEYQRTRGLAVTGEVDRLTLEHLVGEYDRSKDQNWHSGELYPFERQLENEKISLDDEFDLVIVIQLMLETLSRYLDDIAVTEINGRYDAQTKDNVSEFQRISGIKETGEVDQETWNRLAEHYNSLLDQE